MIIIGLYFFKPNIKMYSLISLDVDQSINKIVHIKNIFKTLTFEYFNNKNRNSNLI